MQQHRRRSELDRWRIIVYYGDGLSIGEISLRLHCDRRTVYRWVWSYYRNDVNEKIGSRGRKRHPKMNSKKRLSFAEGKKWQEMSRNVKKYVKEFLEISHMFMYRVLEVRLEQGDLL